MSGLSRSRGSFWSKIRKLFVGFFNRRPERIMRYFQRGYGVERDVFKVWELGRFPPGWDPSLIEMVAVLAVGTATLPFADVVKMLELFLYTGWIDSNVEPFSQRLMETSRAFYGQGWDREAGRLLKVGEISARKGRRKSLEADFRRELDRRTVTRLRDHSFLPERGH